MIGEPKEEIGLRRSRASLRNLFLHDLEVIVKVVRRVMIVPAGLCGFQRCLPLSNPGVLDLHALCLSHLKLQLMLHVFGTTLTLHFLLRDEMFRCHTFALFLPLLLLFLGLFLLARVVVVA